MVTETIILLLIAIRSFFPYYEYIKYSESGDRLNTYSELEHFPYPFKGKIYRYSNNSMPLDPPSSVEVSNKYKQEVKLKRHLLRHHPECCYHSLTHTIDAQWDALALVMDNMTTYFPEKFTLHKNREEWIFHNKMVDEKVTFIFGDGTTLPCEPLDFIGRHVQEDLILMVQKDGELYLDAGQLCFPGNWSLAFNLGMSFKELHHPIPGFNEKGLADRIRQFILRLEDGSPWGRLNWQMQAGNRLDTSLETFDEWGKVRKLVTSENAGGIVHLRVEVQKLFRLPRSETILFTIHTHLLSLEMFAENKQWAKQFAGILEELPPFIYEYKGLSLYREAVIDYLNRRVSE